MLSNEEVAARTLYIAKLGTVEKPTDEAKVSEWEAAQPIAARMREVAALGAFQRLRHMPELMDATNAFHERFKPQI